MENLARDIAESVTRNNQPDNNHKFSTNFSASLLWNYHATDSEEALTCARLTILAEQKRWNPHADIDWAPVNVDSQFPCIRDHDPFGGFAPYDRLSRPERLAISWRRHGMEISEILHAEQLALMCASQLISLMPCMESRLFASTQAADEARHVEFFRRYLASLDMPICQPSAYLRRLAVEVLQNPRWEIKLLICQVLIESLALAQFAYLIETHCRISLQSGLRRILDDEARHVKFGTDYLKSLFRHHTSAQLDYYGHYVVDKAFELASSDNHVVALATKYQWDTHKLRQHLRLRRIARPDLFQQRFRQLSLNIRAIGVMNISVEQRLRRFTGT